MGISPGISRRKKEKAGSRQGNLSPEEISQYKELVRPLCKMRRAQSMGISGGHTDRVCLDVPGPGPGPDRRTLKVNLRRSLDLCPSFHHGHTE